MYVMTWSFLGVTAAVYLATAVSWAELGERFAPAPAALQQQTNEAQRASAEHDGTIQLLRSENAALARRITDLDATLTEERAVAQSLRKDLAAMKATRAQPAANADSGPSNTVEVGAGRVPDPATLSGGQVALRGLPGVQTLNGSAGAGPSEKPQDRVPVAPPVQTTEVSAPEIEQPNRYPPLPPRVPREILASTPTASDISTGSVARVSPPRPEERATAPVAFGAPTVRPAQTDEGADGVALRLSSAPSISSLRLSWRVLRERHGSILSGLNPRFRTVPDGPTGVTYQLVAGPIASRTEADQVCTILRAQDVGCAIDAFAGDPLL